MGENPYLWWCFWQCTPFHCYLCCSFVINTTINMGFPHVWLLNTRLTYWNICYLLAHVDILMMRNVSNTSSNTYFSTHSLWLIKIHMGPTKFTWDPHDLVGPVWILTNQRECVEKYVLEGVLLAFLIND